MKHVDGGKIDVEEFVKALMDLRKMGGWYLWVGTVGGKDIKIKGYQTWLQIFKVDGKDNSNHMDQNASQFKEALLRPFK